MKKSLKTSTAPQYHRNMTTSLVPASLMSSNYSYPQDYTYPVTANDWQHLQSMITVPTVPDIELQNTYTTQVCPYTGILQPVQQYVLDGTLNYDTETLAYIEQIYYNDIENSRKKEQACYVKEDYVLELGDAKADVTKENKEKPLEFYLTLPRELFPPARVFTLDPNPIIDEFCKMKNLLYHTPWLLDLEFGIPKTAITRHIPIYNVKFNSIHCKNTPEAIHPGFESCDPDLKRALLFYYDCVVSAWYKGYIILNCDRSVENFQSWLLLPMQTLGMCWP